MTLERELYIKDRFLNILNMGADLSELCDFLSSCIGMPSAITLPSKTIIAKSQDYSQDIVDEYSNSMNLCSEDELKEIHSELDNALASRRPETRAWPYSRYKRVICGCFWHGRMFGVLDCPIINKNKTEDAELIIGMAAPIFMTALQLNGYVTANTVFPMQSLIVGLLKGSVDEYRQMYAAEYADSKDWRVLFAKSDDPEKSDRLYAAIDAVCMRRGTLWAVEHEGGVVVLLAADDDALLAETEGALKDVGRMGVSDPFRNIFELRSHFQRARFLIRLAQFVYDDSTMVFENKYKVLLEFLSCTQNNCPSLCEPVVEEIKNYDAEHESEYYETLKKYLLLKRDLQAVGEALHIHKNTAAYRIQRITELFGIDFKDNRAITSLYLSLFAEL